MTFENFLDALGGLHDATLEKMEWLPEMRTVALHFDDLLSNFDALKGYKGPQPGVILLSGVSQCLIEVPISEDSKPHVFSFECRPADQESTLVSRLGLWPFGAVEITHRAAEFPEALASSARSIE